MSVSRPDVLVAGRYRLVKRIAAGGMGSVWEAWDETLHRRVALKQLHPQPGLSKAEAQLAANRAMREARITARLHHAHAVPVYDVVDWEGQPCLIMQFLPSKSLQTLLSEKGVLSVPEVARIGSEVAAALAAAHQAGIVHRDVKPGNLLIGQDGAAKLTDFGISHALGDVTLTSTGMVTGTPAFLAPEVARGIESGFASDVFSLGSTLYAALEGAPPFGTGENPMAVLHKVASGQAVPPRRSGELTPVLLRMLAADPSDRPSMKQAAELLSAVHASAWDPTADVTTQRMTAVRPVAQPPWTTVTLPAVRPAPPPATSHPRPRPRRRVAAIGLVALLILLGLAIVLATDLLGGGTNGTGGRAAAGSTPQATSRPNTGSASTSPPSPRTTSPSSPQTTRASSATAISRGRSATPTAARLEHAIENYYALLPGNTGAGWSRLTAAYQSGHANGLQNYRRFWDAIESVTVSDVTANPPRSVQARITYVYKDGRVYDERTAFELVPRDGILKINATYVLSSTRR